jgi:hypothetical protein
MKKYALVVVLTLMVAFLAGSCNRETCPAYSKVDSKTSEHVG